MELTLCLPKSHLKPSNDWFRKENTSTTSLPTPSKIYRAAWQKWQKYGPDPVEFVAGMRKAGTTATGANIHIRSLNALFRWAGHLPIRKPKEEQVIPPTFSPADVQKLARFKPSKRDRRIFTLMLLLLDTGVRISRKRCLFKSPTSISTIRGHLFNS